MLHPSQLDEQSSPGIHYCWAMQVTQSDKLATVVYDIRGPVLKRAMQLEASGHPILKLHIGNPAPFGFEAPPEILQDVIANLPNAHGYSDSKSHAETNCNAFAHSNGDSKCDAAADINTDSHPNGQTDSNPQCQSDSNPNAHCDAHTNGDFNSYTNVNSYADRDADTHANGNSHSNSY